MKRAKAQYAMRQPRKCQIVGTTGQKQDWHSWYYVEDRGLDILVRKPGVGCVAIKITKRQLEQALSLIRHASAPLTGE